MFQYAMGKAIALDHEERIYLDLSFLNEHNVSSSYFTARKFALDIFDCEFKIASSEIQKKFQENLFLNRIKRKIGLKNYEILNEQEVKGYDEVKAYKPPVMFIGFWQSEIYFAHHSDAIRRDFQFHGFPDCEIQKWRSRIEASNSVSVHVRRGDYLTNTLAKKVLGVLDFKYYQDAISFISESIESPHFFFFSDDITWCKEQFHFLPNVSFVTDESTMSESQDMFLMSTCKHNIIANSSFSWWAAWLNSNSQKIVIAPKTWYKDESFLNKDLIPKNWVKL